MPFIKTIDAATAKTLFFLDARQVVEQRSDADACVQIRRLGVFGAVDVAPDRHFPGTV